MAYENGKAWEEARGDVLKARRPQAGDFRSVPDDGREPDGHASAGLRPRFFTGNRWACCRDRAFNFPAMIPMGWMTPMCIMPAPFSYRAEAATFTPQSCMLS